MSDDWPELTIGEVARRAGVATSAIRYYERVGLLPPADRVSGQRRYGEETVGRLAFISVAQNAGFRLREIRELLARTDSEHDLAGPMRALSARKLPEVRAAIERAEAMRGWLEVVSSCQCERADECTPFPAGDGPVVLDVIKVPASASCRRDRSLTP